MYIGKLAEKTGASIKAIRLYEELGLLTKVERSGSYRVYNEDHVVLVRLIVEAKSLGFKLSELRHFVERSESSSPWQCIVEMIDSKQAVVNAELKALQSRSNALSIYRDEISACLAGNADCALDETALDSAPKGRLQDGVTNPVK